jgi:hydroxymethylpyrimidine/phosphomethylpyrimidine kinase
VLSIAGSDSGGGAGIQADLKAFARCGVHGMTAITAITAQNTVGVTAVHPVPPEIVLAQVRAVAQDIGVDAVKLGMLGNAQTVQAVAQALGELPPSAAIVLDPVMVSESGARLLEEDAESALIEQLLPLATVVTPNMAEARALSAGAPGPRAGAPGADSDERAEAELLVRAVHALGPRAVVVTGGHRRQAVDVFFDGETVTLIPGEREPDGATHGSGCTHSAVLAARLALGDDPLAAARCARVMAGAAVRDGLASLGAGSGPVDVIGLLRGVLQAGPTHLS